MKRILCLIVLIVGCGSGQSELSAALDECLHNCNPGDDACRDRCISRCSDDCLGDCPGWDCRVILTYYREENSFGWPQDCADSDFCFWECQCYNHETCLAAGEMVFGADAPCPDSLYDRCKDTCYAF